MAQSAAWKTGHLQATGEKLLPLVKGLVLDIFVVRKEEGRGVWSRIVGAWLGSLIGWLEKGGREVQ